MQIVTQIDVERGEDDEYRVLTIEVSGRFYQNEGNPYTASSDYWLDKVDYDPDIELTQAEIEHAEQKLYNAINLM